MGHQFRKIPVLGQHPEVVRDSFNRALELDPGNTRIIQNRAVALMEAEQPKGTPGGYPWQVTQGAESVALRQVLRERIDVQQGRAGQQMDEPQLLALVS